MTSCRPRAPHDPEHSVLGLCVKVADALLHRCMAAAACMVLALSYVCTGRAGQAHAPQGIKEHGHWLR